MSGRAERRELMSCLDLDALIGMVRSQVITRL